MFAVSDDELLFDEALQAGLQAELLRTCGLDEDVDPDHVLDRNADDLWTAYTTPALH